MLPIRRWFLMVQHVIFFTSLAYTAHHLVAFSLSSNGVLELTRAVFFGDLAKCFFIGAMVSIVLLGRDVFLNKRKQDA